MKVLKTSRHNVQVCTKGQRDIAHFMHIVASSDSCTAGFIPNKNQGHVCDVQRPPDGESFMTHFCFDQQQHRADRFPVLCLLDFSKHRTMQTFNKAKRLTLVLVHSSVFVRYICLFVCLFFKLKTKMIKTENSIWNNSKVKLELTKGKSQVKPVTHRWNASGCGSQSTQRPASRKQEVTQKVTQKVTATK